MKIYDVRDLMLDKAKWGEIYTAVRSIGALCAGNQQAPDASLRDGKLVICTDAWGHRIVGELLEHVRARPHAWIPAAEWQKSFREAVKGVDRITVGPELSIADRWEVLHFLGSLDFCDSYDRIDCECRLEWLVKFYKGETLVGGLEYLPDSKFTQIRWIGGPWKGNATLSEESAKWLAAFLKENGVRTRQH